MFFLNSSNVFKNTLTLTLSGIIAKTIDFSFRTYYSKKLGAEGCGLLSLILGIYSVFLIISSCSLSSAVSKVVSSQISRKNFAEVKCTVHAAIKGVFFTSLIMIFAAVIFIDYICIGILKDERAKLPLLCILPSMLFMGTSYCLKAYFYSARKVLIPASSEFVEQFIKITVITTLLFYFLPFGIAYGCTAVFIGISFGEFSSCLYLYLFYMREQKNFPSAKTSFSPYKSLLKIAIPDTSSTLISSYLQTTEELLFISGLITHGFTRKEALSTYGSISGMALPLTSFPLNLLSSFLTLLVPEISRACALKNKLRLKSISNKVFKFSACCSFLVSTVLFMHAKELSEFFYANENISSYIITLCAIIPITLFDSVSHRILAGLGKEKLLFIITVSTAVLKTTLTYFLAPKTGVSAIIISIYAGSLFAFFVKLIFVMGNTGFDFDFFSYFLLPLVAAFTTVILRNHFILYYENLIIKIFITISLFTICLFIFKIIRKSDINWVKDRIKN